MLWLVVSIQLFNPIIPISINMKTYVISDKAEMESIINDCSICFVGIADGEQQPYVVPMNFGYYEDEIILHSGPLGKHLDLLAKNNRVCITFCTEGKLVYQHVDVACSYRMDAKSVICNGEVSCVEDLTEKETLLNRFMKKYTDRYFSYSQPALKNVKVWGVKVTEMTAKSFGQPHRK